MNLRRLNLGLCLAIAFAALPAWAAEEAPDAGLVQITVTYQENDPFLPWQKVQPGVRTGYGVAVSNSRVLTTESLIRNGKLVELRRPKTGEKIPATVLLSDSEVNLALLAIEANAKADGLVALPLADNLDRKAKVEILQFDKLSQVQRGDARILHVAMADLPKAPYQSLTFDLLTDLNVNGEGAAVVKDGKLAGLVMSHDQVARIAAMIPYPVIRQFMRDADNPVYTGFASAGFFWTSLVDPSKRSYLKVDAPGKGILVLSCVPGTGASESLKPNDVILEWDGHSVDNLGYYEDESFGRLAMSYLIKGWRKPGDGVTVKVVRDQAVATVQLKLCHQNDRDSLVPENVLGEPADYLVEGGFVITELTGRYLRARGDWEHTVDPRIVHTYLAAKRAASVPGEHVVILSGILPDPINIGYQQRFHDEIITAVNGQAVSNMTDVFRIVDKEGSLQRLTLKSMGVDLVIDQHELATANARLARQYRVPALRFQTDRTR